MSETGGPKELQELEAEIAMLKSQQEGMKEAGKGSETLASMVQHVISNSEDDGFLHASGVRPPNRFHSNVASSGQAGEGGCCTVI